MGSSRRAGLRRRITLFVVGGLLLTGLTAAAGGTSRTEDVKFTASDGAMWDHFGSAVGISGDTAVVGAQGNSIFGFYPGYAYVFSRADGCWREEVRLAASDGASGDLFGYAVAVSGDTLVVGAPWHNAVGPSSGSVYVFVRDGTNWSEQAKLTPSDAATGDRFGHSVAILNDTVVGGAVSNDDGGFTSGSAYVFVRDGTNWSEQAKLTASDASGGDQFGYSVAISGDTIVVGALRNDDAGQDSGSAYVFVNGASAWSEQAKLTAPDASRREFFGAGVAVSGETALVAAPNEFEGGDRRGSGYVFARSGDSWALEAKLVAGHASNSEGSVALLSDTAVIGVRTETGAGTASGAVHVFRRDNSEWMESDVLTASDAAAWDTLGTAVALSDKTVLAGAPLHDRLGRDSGAAYIFDLAGPITRPCAPQVDADFVHGDTFPSGTVALTGTVSDDIGVRWVRVAIRDRMTRLWLQDDMTTWGSFNRFNAVMADPSADTTTWSFELDVPDGTYALSARTKDRDGLIGHITPWRRFNVGDDSTPPTVDADFVAGAHFDSPIQMTGTASDDHMITRVRVGIRQKEPSLWLQDDMVSWGPFNRFPALLAQSGAASTAWSFDVELPPGEYILSVRATDLLGNEASIQPWRPFSVRG